MIESYFEKYPGSLISFNYVSGVKTIHFWKSIFWEMPQEILGDNILVIERKDVVHQEDANKYYCVMHPANDNEGNPVSITYDDLFNALSNFFDYNIEYEKKKVLLENKINELQGKFNEFTLEELQKMDFK